MLSDEINETKLSSPQLIIVSVNYINHNRCRRFYKLQFMLKVVCILSVVIQELVSEKAAPSKIKLISRLGRSGIIKVIRSDSSKEALHIN